MIPAGPDVTETPTFAVNLVAGANALPVALARGAGENIWVADVDVSSLGADDSLAIDLGGSIGTSTGALALSAHSFQADTLAPRLFPSIEAQSPVRRDGVVAFTINFEERNPDDASTVRFGALPATSGQRLTRGDCELTGTIEPAADPASAVISIPARQPGLPVDGAEVGYRFGLCVADRFGNMAVEELTGDVVITRRAFAVSTGTDALTSPAMLPDGSFAFGAADAVANFRIVPADAGVPTTLSLGASGAITFAPVVSGGRMFVAKGRSLIVRDVASIGGDELWACPDAAADFGSPPVIGTLQRVLDPLVVLSRQGRLQGYASAPTCATVPSSDFGIGNSWPVFGVSGELYVGGNNATSFQTIFSDSSTEPTLSLGSQRDGSGSDLQTIRLAPALDGTTAWVAPLNDPSAAGFIDLTAGTAASVLHGNTNTAAPIVSATHAVFPTDAGLVFVNRTIAGSVELTSNVVTLGAEIPGSPLAGSDGLIYAVDAAGTVHVLAPPGAPNAGLLFSAPLDNAPGASVAITTSPTLTSSGLLVIGDSSGTVHGFLTDATSGLDPNAPWPKYQHDAGNTGNASAPLYP